MVGKESFLSLLQVHQFLPVVEHPLLHGEPRASDQLCGLGLCTVGCQESSRVVVSLDKVPSVR